ncbi:hypothetical protein F2Q69_00016016 [Brassica cretica]|uniref:Uncharacterized protein n=1 Tax=Brassica cretica TaxID=69181 RepID=A0A8S9R741_BRACR|nr:hypothetical protein F2Q69_00016016 [Brassica cretica]
MISAHASGKSQIALIGFISSNRAPRYEPQLKPGANYSLQNFFATTIDQMNCSDAENRRLTKLPYNVAHV